MSKYYGGYYSYGGGYGGYSYNNSYWNDIYSKYASTFSTAEEKREFKKKITEESRKRFFPTKISVGSGKTSFFKKRKMEININIGDLGKFKGKETKIVEAFEKFPYFSDIGDSEAFIWYLTERSSKLSKYLNGTLNSGDIIKAYFEGKTTYAEYRKIFKDIKAIVSDGKGIEEHGNYRGGGSVGYKKQLAMGMYEKTLRIIQSKIKPRQITMTEESLRKGKRINRNFINGTSYKPLMEKTIETNKRKKIMFIIDCSGSMGNADEEGDPAHKGMSFVAAAVNSGVFDCDHVILHSSGGWENVIREIRKRNLFSYYGGGEGFEEIDDNLDREFLRGVDYVVCITDMIIGKSAQRGLYEYLKKGKKHLIMSFNRAGDLNGMNVRQIKTPQNMINALVSMVGS